MTKEEKAKRYDETLEQARKELNTCGSLDCDAARQILRFFPQLRESEDERIRKEIVSVIQKHYPNTPESYRWISWLEKQKEQKPNNNFLSIEQQMEAAMIAIRGGMSSKSQEWSEEDEEILDGIINTLDRLGYAEFCKSSREEDIEEERLYYKEIQCLKKLKSLRPSWKPSEEQDSVAEKFARIVRGNLIGIDKEVQQKFEQLYFEVTGNKMYGGYND